jgi:hypothetical protein
MMVQKSVLLISVFAFGLTLGSGAEATKPKRPIPQVDGQSKLFECEGWPTTMRRQIKATADKENKQREEEKDQRQRDKDNRQLENQRLQNYRLKVDRDTQDSK